MNRYVILILASISIQLLVLMWSICNKYLRVLDSSHCMQHIDINDGLMDLSTVAEYAA